MSAEAPAFGPILSLLFALGEDRLRTMVTSGAVGGLADFHAILAQAKRAARTQIARAKDAPLPEKPRVRRRAMPPCPGGGRGVESVSVELETDPYTAGDAAIPRISRTLRCCGQDWHQFGLCPVGTGMVHFVSSGWGGRWS